MVKESLLTYVNQERAAGYGDEEIREALLKAGYRDSEIDLALRAGSHKRVIFGTLFFIAVIGIVFYLIVQQGRPSPESQPPYYTQGALDELALVYRQNAYEYHRRILDPTVVALKACAQDCAYFENQNLIAACEEQKPKYLETEYNQTLCASETLKDVIACRALTTIGCERGFEDYLDDIAVLTLRKASNVSVSCGIIHTPELRTLCDDARYSSEQVDEILERA